MHPCRIKVFILKIFTDPKHQCITVVCLNWLLKLHSICTTESNERHWWLDQCSTDRSFEMVCCECKEFSLVVSIFSIYSMKVLGLGTNGNNMVLNLHWLVEGCLRNNSWHLNRSISIGFPFCISYPLCDINERVRWRTSLIAECCSIGWRCCQTGTKYSLQNPNRKTTRLSALPYKYLSPIPPSPFSLLSSGYSTLGCRSPFFLCSFLSFVFCSFSIQLSLLGESVF